MNSKANSFTCAECGERRPLAALSEQSLRLANTASRIHAAATLPEYELICRDCDSPIDDDLPVYLLERSRSGSSAWELSGVYIDPAKLQAYNLNY